MANKTPEEHASDKAMAEQLMAMGRIRTWAQLGKAFGISGQAAHARFGPKGYGLSMPKRGRQKRRMVSVSLGQQLHELVEQIRTDWPTEDAPSRARIVRLVLDAELERYAQDPERFVRG